MKKSGVGFIQNGKMVPVSDNQYNFAMSSFEDGSKVTWTIQSYIRKKSLGQNNLFHMLCEILAKDLGWTRDDVKIYLKDKHGVYEPLCDRQGNEMVDEDTGEILMRMKSLSDYSKEEMSYLITGTYEFAHKYNIRLPNPEDLRHHNIPI